MTFINLRDFYPWYTADQIVQVSDEVYEELVACRRSEVSYQRRALRHKAQYSLDAEDGIESHILHMEPSPEDLVLREELFYELWNALNSLPELQGKRVEACVLNSMSYRERGRREKVNASSIREAVKKGLATMRKYLLEIWE